MTSIEGHQLRQCVAAFATLAALAGCAAHPGELARPVSGYAKVYVLRPAFSDVSSNDRPMLYIDGREASQLRFKSFSEFVLAPGTYNVSVRPRQSESAIWNGDHAMSVEADQTYYLAIWNDVEYREEIRAWYFPLPMPYSVSVGHNTSLHFEMVAQADALPVIRSLNYVRPIAKEFRPVP